MHVYGQPSGVNTSLGCPSVSQQRSLIVVYMHVCGQPSARAWVAPV